MARGMDYLEATDGVAVFKDNIRSHTGRAGAKMHRKTACIIYKPCGIFPVDCHFCLAHMGDLFYMSRMVEVAMGQNNCVDIILERMNGHRKKAGIHKDRAKNVRVRERPLFGDPPDLHAQ